MSALLWNLQRHAPGERAQSERLDGPEGVVRANGGGGAALTGGWLTRYRRSSPMYWTTVTL